MPMSPSEMEDILFGVLLAIVILLAIGFIVAVVFMFWFGIPIS